MDFGNDGWLDLFLANGHVYPGGGAAPDGGGLRAAQGRLRESRQRPLRGRDGAAGRCRRPRRGRPAGPPSATSTTTATWTWWSATSTRRPTCSAPTPSPAATGCSSSSWARRRTAARSARAWAARPAGATQWQEVRGGGSYISQNDLRAHFGLGAAAKVDRLWVRWPNGLEEEWRDVAADQILTLREGTGHEGGAMTRRGPAVHRAGRARRAGAFAPRRRAARPLRRLPRRPLPSPSRRPTGCRPSLARARQLIDAGLSARPLSRSWPALPPGDPRVRVLIGVALYHAERSRCARSASWRRCIDDAAPDSPEWREATQVLGLSHYLAGRLPEADPAPRADARVRPRQLRAGLRCWAWPTSRRASPSRARRPGRAPSACPRTRRRRSSLDGADDGARGDGRDGAGGAGGRPRRRTRGCPRRTSCSARPRCSAAASTRRSPSSARSSR